MANNSEKYIQSVALQSGTGIGPVSNTPIQYGNRQHQYLAHRTEQYIKARAKYSSDFVQANVQGLFKDDFYRYASTFIRLADIAAQSANGSKNVDDVKVILFSEPSIDYFPIGAKIQTMGSTWICTNPSNISSVHSTAVVQRCNAAYSLYDYYGNIVTEPIIVEKTAMSSNDNGTPQNLVMMEGYFTVICQLNKYTRQLGQNQRIILGSKAYFITGFTDFIQEFTGDYDSVHLLRFSIRIEEPTDNDDLVNHIANGNNYSFYAQIQGTDNLAVGAEATLNAYFIKNGITVEVTEEHPLTWIWESSDESIATVDDNGKVTGVSEGTVTITARLLQSVGQINKDAMVIATKLSVNPDAGELIAVYPENYRGTTFNLASSNLSAYTPKGIQPASFELSQIALNPKDGFLQASVNTNIVIAKIDIAVKNVQQISYVAFINPVPTKIQQYESISISAGYYEGNTLTNNIISWNFSGASEDSYYITTDGNTLTIICLHADNTPLTVTAIYEDYSVSAQIQLEGY